jgi:hypothetical protein
MKDILFVLSKMDGITRSDIIYVIEGKEWKRITKKSGVANVRIPLDKIRVSYDRTLKRLKELGLIKGGFPQNSAVYLHIKILYGEDIHMNSLMRGEKKLRRSCKGF